jgi:hypothetical protein
MEEENDEKSSTPLGLADDEREVRGPGIRVF